MSKPKLENSIQELKNDTHKLFEDLGNLSKTLATVGKEKTKELGDDFNEKAKLEIKALTERLRTMESKTKEITSATDKHIKENPYAYIAGFLGLGFLLGKFWGPRNH